MHDTNKHLISPIIQRDQILVKAPQFLQNASKVAKEVFIDRVTVFKKRKSHQIFGATFVRKTVTKTLLKKSNLVTLIK